MKKVMISVWTLFCVIGTWNAANAELITIGTATYNGNDLKLIWDDDNNGKSVVWLDYSIGPESWGKLKGKLQKFVTRLYNIETPGYEVNWIDETWRLPETVDDQFFGFQRENFSTSEMGHLFYEELNNEWYWDENGNPVPGQGLTNTGPFDRLGWANYHSATDYSVDPRGAYYFHMGHGTPGFWNKNSKAYGLPLRTAAVTRINVVPEPGTLVLFGFGLLALASAGRKRLI